MAVTEAGRVLALGRAVQLGDASVVLKFDLEAMAELEDAYGDSALTKFTGDLEAFTYRGVWRGLVVGLCHTGLTRAERTALVRARSFYVQRRRAEFFVPILEAFFEGLPPLGEGDLAGKAAGEAAGSPGEATTDSSPAASDAATGTSAA